ncbi:hypothetical protein HQ447_16485, partial [bacterium]|nr:hypothetical protein [bacterium]
MIIKRLVDVARMSGQRQSTIRFPKIEISRWAPEGSGRPFPPGARIWIGVSEQPSMWLSFTTTSLELPASIHQNSGEISTAAIRLWIMRVATVRSDQHEPSECPGQDVEQLFRANLILHIRGAHFQGEDVAQRVYQNVALSSCNLDAYNLAPTRNQKITTEPTESLQSARSQSEDFTDKSLRGRDAYVCHCRKPMRIGNFKPYLFMKTFVRSRFIPTRILASFFVAALCCSHSASAADVIWSGALNSNWETNTLNWTSGIIATTYANGDSVLFDDSASGSTSVTIDTMVGPSGVAVNNSVQDYTLAGAGGIAGTGSLNKLGSGTLTLLTENTYTGATKVIGGTLWVDGTLAGGGAVNVANGCTLGGTGSIGGPINVQGTLRPGLPGAGTLATGTVTIPGTYDCEIDGTASDLLAVSGDLDLTNATLAISLLNPPTATSYLVATYSNNLNGKFAVTGQPPGSSVDYSTPGQVRLVMANARQVQASLNYDGSILTITGTPQDDIVEIHFSTGGTPGGDVDILSGGNVIFHLTEAQRLALQECQVTLYEGKDRFLVFDSPAVPFNQTIVWKLDGGAGDDVIAPSGPATGSTGSMVLEWEQLRPAVEASGQSLVDQAQTVMDQRMSWAGTQVADLLRVKSAAERSRALALIDRLAGDSPGSLVSRTAVKINLTASQIANEGPEALMDRKSITEEGDVPAGGPNRGGDKGISEKGLPYYGVDPLYDAEPVIQRIAEAEARMESLFNWLPAPANDGDAAGLDESARLAQSLAFANDINLSLETLGRNSELDIAAACDPIVSDMVALSDYLAAHSIALANTLEADAIQNFAPLYSEVADGPNGTDAFQAHMATYQANGELIGTAAATECDNQILAIMASLSALEIQLSSALQSMDTPDGSPFAGGSPALRSASLSLLACSITTSNTITGGPGVDLLFGTSANDKISGGGGADFIFGMGGDDEIEGDAGVDFLFGMKGGDDISGGDDTDVIFGDAIFWSGNDCLHGDAGIDVMLGEKADDGMEGGDDLDLMVGGAGTDIMLGDKGNDLMLGWTGDDSLDGGDDSDLMLGDYPLAPAGNDTLVGSGGTTITILGVNYEIGDFQFGNEGDDSITGGSGIDFQWGNPGADTMNGDSNIDVMFGGDGPDTMEGELGGTLLVVSGVPVRFGNLMFGNADPDTVTGGGDFDIIFGNGAPDQLFGGKNSSFHPLGIDIDLIFGNDGDDYADGHNMADLIFGNDGNDELHGDLNAWYQVNSHDLVFGNDGHDKVFGGNGNDLCFGNQGDDSINGEWNPILDILFGNDGNDVVDGDGGSDLIFGNLGDDTLLGGHGLLDIIFGNDGNDTISGQGGVDLVFGSAGNDVIDGGPFSDILFGNDDDDTISGGDFPDLIFGNGGCDTITGNNGFDIAFGNDEDDTIQGNDGVDFLFGNNGNDILSGNNGIDTIFGGDNNDIITGDDGFDLLFGNSGDDEVHGNNGLDIIFGNDGNDCLSGDDGVDLVFGNQGNDNIHGGSHLDTLFGNEGDDCIFGDNAVDLIWGGGGNDDIYGGVGSDAIWGG